MHRGGKNRPGRAANDDKAAAAARRPRLVRTTEHPPAVLLVTPDRDLRRDTARELAGSAWRLTAASFDDAYARALVLVPDTILLDARDGATTPLARRLAADERLRRARLLALVEPGSPELRRLELFGYVCLTQGRPEADPEWAREIDDA